MTKSASDLDNAASALLKAFAKEAERLRELRRFKKNYPGLDHHDFEKLEPDNEREG